MGSKNSDNTIIVLSLFLLPILNSVTLFFVLTVNDTVVLTGFKTFNIFYCL